MFGGFPRVAIFLMKETKIKIDVKKSKYVTIITQTYNEDGTDVS